MRFGIPVKQYVAVVSLVVGSIAFGGMSTMAGQLGTGDVTVNLEVYTCPAGTDPALDRETLTETCLDPADPYAITIGDGESWASGADTTGDAPQTVQFLEVPAGLVQIVQHVPDGMVEPVFFCAKDGGEFATPLNYELDSDTFELRAFMNRMEAGSSLSCQAFNFPAGGEATPELPGAPGINLAFRACPEGTLVEAPFDALAETCREPLATAGVVVLNGEGYMHASGSGGTPVEVREIWIDEVPGGTLTIAAGSDDGFTVDTIACGEAGADLVELETRHDGTVLLEYAEGTTVLCEVFLIPFTAEATPGAVPMASPVASPAALPIA